MNKITLVITYDSLTADPNAEALLQQEVKETFTQLTASLKNQAGNVKGNLKFQTDVEEE